MCKKAVINDTSHWLGYRIICLLGTRFEGVYVNGRREGKGKLTLANGNEFEGNFKNGRSLSTECRFGQDLCRNMCSINRPDGFGAYKWNDGGLNDGDRYEGNYENGKRSGQGTLGVYEA